MLEKVKDNEEMEKKEEKEEGMNEEGEQVEKGIN